MMIKEIESIEFHDQGLKNWRLDFGNNEIYLKFEILKNNDYSELEISFSAIHNLKVSEWELRNMEELEVYRFEVDTEKNIVYLSILTEFGGPSIEIEFGFKTYKVIKPKMH